MIARGASGGLRTRRGRRGPALLVLLALTSALLAACQEPLVPEPPRVSGRRPTSTPAALAPAGDPAGDTLPADEEPGPAQRVATATLPSLPTAGAPADPACAPADDYALEADFLGVFRFDLLGTTGRNGVVDYTRVAIRSAPVGGPNGSVQLALWFQGAGGPPEWPYVVQLRLLATADCLAPGSGAGLARVLPALQPGDFLVPPRAFGATSIAGLQADDPYDFRVYVRAADGSLPAQELPAEYGFVTGGLLALHEYAPGLGTWHAQGTFTVTLALYSGRPVAPFSGRFDLLRP
jgi:hypothetical protein